MKSYTPKPTATRPELVTIEQDPDAVRASLETYTLEEREQAALEMIQADRERPGDDYDDGDQIDEGGSQ